MASDDDMSGRIVAAAIVSALAGISFTVARIYSNGVLLHRWHRENSIVALACALLITGCALVGLMSRSGFGRHVATLTIQQQIDARFYLVLSTWPALLAIGVPKLAVAGLLCRVFSPGPWTRSFLWGVAWCGVLSYAAEAAFSTFQCIPVQASWDFRIKGAKCVEITTYINFSWYTGAYSAAADFILACYPALVFRKMRFSVWKKIGLSLLMGIGVFATGVAILKVTYLGTIDGEDWTWDRTYLVIWTVVEAAVIISTACIPVLHPIYDQIFKALQPIFCGRRGINKQPAKLYDNTLPGQIDETRAGFWTRKMRSAMGSHVGSGTNWLSTSNTVEAGGVLDFSPPRSETPYAEMSRKQPAKSINIEMAAGSAPASRLVLDTGAGSSNFTTPYKGRGSALGVGQNRSNVGQKLGVLASTIDDPRNQ